MGTGGRPHLSSAERGFCLSSCEGGWSCSGLSSARQRATSRMRTIFDAKYQGATKTLTFDFTSALGASETISTATTSATTFSGTDASPASIISGSATISGKTVTQKITAGTSGVSYNLTCEITTSLGQTLQMQGYLAVIPAAA